MSRPPSPMYLYARSVRRPPYPIYLYARSASRPPYPIYLYAGSASRPPCPIYLCAGSAGRPPYPIYLCAVRMKTNLSFNTLPACIHHYGCNNQGSEALKDNSKKTKGNPPTGSKPSILSGLADRYASTSKALASKRAKKTKPTKGNLPTWSTNPPFLTPDGSAFFFWCGEPLCLNK